MLSMKRKSDESKDINQDDYDKESDFTDDLKSAGSDNYTGRYYSIKNFNKMVDEVMYHQHDSTLFSTSEKSIIRVFRELLDENSKQLLLRMFMRLSKWLRYDKKINDSNRQFFTELLDKELITNDLCNTSLDEKLNLLYNDELIKIGKEFNLKFVSKRRSEMIECIQKASCNKSDLTRFFKSTKNISLQSKFDKSVNTSLKSTFKVSSNVRIMLAKIVTLFTITSTNLDEYSGIGDRCQKELFNLWQLESGNIILPLYKLSRVCNIFATENSLNRYADLLDRAMRMCHLIKNKKFDTAYEEFCAIKESFPSDLLLSTYDDDCPSNILRKYGFSSLLLKTYSASVDLLEKRREYANAVQLLEKLLEATKSSTASKKRGKLFLRICVDLRHLKDNVRYEYWLSQALKDSSIPSYFRLTFRNRMDKLRIESAESVESIPDELELLNNANVKINIWREIDAPWDADRNDNKPYYIWLEGETQILCSVEEFVIRSMKHKQSYSQGIHSESGIFILFFVLFFYDIIFSDVPDAFYTFRQTMPLDMFSSTFADKRRQIVDDRLNWLGCPESTDDAIIQMALSNWANHRHESVLGVNWDILDTDNDVVNVFNCLGRNVLVGVCKNFTQNFSFWSSGMPDLLLWNTSERRHEIIEVKGPGDRLSDKQKIWIMELQQMGANVSVCNVRRVNRKRL